MNLKYASLVGAIVCAISIAGCGSDSGPAPGRARIYHAVTTGALVPVDVAINSKTAATNLSYGTLSSSVEVDSGAVKADVKTTSGGVAVLTQAPLSVTSSVDNLLVIGGKASGTGASAIHIGNLGRLDLSGTPTSGQVRIYFANAVVDSPTAGVNLSMTQSGSLLSPLAWHNINYGQMAIEQLVTFGDTVFSVNVGGEIVSAASVTLTGSKTYLVILRGNPASLGIPPALGLDVIQLN